MPGSIIFRPIEANLTHNTDFIKRMNPYCAFIVGNKRFNSQICKHGGKHPVWNDAVTVPIMNESMVTVEVMDKDNITKDDQIGIFKLDLVDLQSQGQTSSWYPLYYKNKPAGELLMETSIQGDLDMAGEQQFINQPGLIEGQQFINQPGFVQIEETILQEKPLIQEGVKTFVEQRQSVEPHTFLKEVDVVETRPVQKEIEVMEPRKVLKEVQYTEAVPVKKQIETLEPQVITKEVEVMEPRLVTKEIQVIENVPVIKKVEVIENVPIIKEVETMEPQTFVKEVEVTEQVPVMKRVTVTEPITVKKAVEFVEPIITTQTITKEIRPEIIVDEKITKSVGPATYVGEYNELSKRFGSIKLTEEERLRYLAISEEERLKLNEEERWRWMEAQRLTHGNFMGQSNYPQQGFGGQSYSGNYPQQGFGGQSYSGNYPQQGLGGQSMQFNQNPNF